MLFRFTEGLERIGLVIIGRDIINRWKSFGCDTAHMNPDKWVIKIKF